MHAVEESRLEANLTSSLATLADIGVILSELESVLMDGESEGIDRLVSALDEKKLASERLAIERSDLLPARTDYDSCLSLFSVREQARVARTLSALRTNLTALRRQQERIWISLTIRAMVVDRTLQVVSGGSAEAYDSSGQMAASTARPILHHQRC